MAALPQVLSRTGQREEPGGSADSSASNRTPVPTVSSATTEGVSPAQVAETPGKNLWELICEEYEAEIPPFPEGYKVKQKAAVTVSPVEATTFHGFNTSHYIPISQVTTAPHIPCPQAKLETVDPKTCSPKEYLETFIFPVLLPGMASLLHQAKKEKCFERKRTKFIACDFLTEWLYNQNPKRLGEPFTEFFSIPFVEERLKHHPRPPIPLSLLLTEEAAAIAIQSFWRAYLLPKHQVRTTRLAGLSCGFKRRRGASRPLFGAHGVPGKTEEDCYQKGTWRPEHVVRCDPEIQELRQWQKKLREDKHIRQRVQFFWAKLKQKVKCEMEDNEELENIPSP